MTSPSLLQVGEVHQLAGDLLARGSPIQVAVRGGCMRPWAFPGDHIEVAPLRHPLRLGTVVLVGQAGVLTAHRVVALAGGRVRTQGDLEPRPDAWLDATQVMGAVVAVRSATSGRWRRLDGWAAHWLGRHSAPLWRGLQRLVRVARRASLR